MRLRNLVPVLAAGSLLLAGGGAAYAADADPLTGCQAAAVKLNTAQERLDAALADDQAAADAKTAAKTLADAQAELDVAAAAANLRDPDTGVLVTRAQVEQRIVEIKNFLGGSTTPEQRTEYTARLGLRAEQLAKIAAVEAAQAAAEKAGNPSELQAVADRTDADGLRALRDEAKAARDKACTAPTAVSPTSTSPAPATSTPPTVKVIVSDGSGNTSPADATFSQVGAVPSGSVDTGRA